MRRLVAVLLLSLVWTAASVAGDVQTDWSSGAGQPGAVTDWENSFDSATDISWLSIPGQVALSANGLTMPSKHTLSTGNSGAFGIEAVDINGDGDVDIIGAAERAAELTIWHNNGTTPPTFTVETIDTAYSGISGVFATDLDGDLDLDLVTCTGIGLGPVKCYINDGGETPTWSIQIIDDGWGAAWEIAAADVDGDELQDVICTSLGLDSVVWWKNDGQTPIGWTRHTVDSNTNGAHSARVGDLNGDGHADVLGAGTITDEVVWWESDGQDPITWTKHVVGTSFAGGRSVRIGDIDGDGDLDAAAVGFGSRVQWWSNEGGSPIVWEPQIVAYWGQVHQLQLADVNGDGRLDMVAAAYNGGSLAWWENGGGTAPITWTKRGNYFLNGPLALDVGDIDGDGKLELLGSSNSLGQFCWWDAATFMSAGSLTSSILDRGTNGASELNWTAETPPGTSLHFQVRSSDDANDLGAWSADIITPGPLDGTPGRYLQYRVNMSTTDSSVSPLLTEVSLNSSAAAVIPGASSLNLTTYPNPANPRVMIAFELPNEGPARLEIFDVRGRKVRTLANTNFAAGPNEVLWNGIDAHGQGAASGVYYVQLNTRHGIQLSQVALVR